MTDRRRVQIEPLRELEGDVPLPYTVEAIHPAQTAVSLGVGRTITITPDGVVRNASGTPLFRLVRLATRERQVDR